MNGKKQKIVTIGGGTGSFVTLSGLKNYNVELSAIVSMSDDGGSTGILRDELGVLPPGDIRQCLVALSQSSQILRELFNYRYAQGRLKGHNFGNIFLSTLEKISGSFEKAVKEAGLILQIKGRVIPVTLKNTKLAAKLADGKKIIGQDNINRSDLAKLEKIYLSPASALNPEAKRLIREADKIIINPGNFYCSIIPNFLVLGLAKAVAAAKAKKIFISNLMTKQGHTENFSIVDYINILEKYLGKGVIDYAIYNKEFPGRKLLEKYASEGEFPVKIGNLPPKPKIKFLGYNLLSHKIYKQKPSDLIKRTLIRHDSDKLAKAILDL